MRKTLTALTLLAAMAISTQANSMGGGVPLTADEIAHHNAILKKVQADQKKAPVLHRAVVPQPKAAPQAKTPAPVKAKPTTALSRLKSLLKRWF